MFISTVGAFYSKLYDLSKHPNYINLYEPWYENKDKIYNHKIELEQQKNSNYKLLCELGLEFAVPIDKPKIENVNKNELKTLRKTKVIQYEDLKVNN